MRCAELLEYGGGGSGTGLGWHWDVGSTLTLVAMLNTSTQVRRRPLTCALELAMLGSRPHHARTRYLGKPRARLRHSHRYSPCRGRRAASCSSQLTARCSACRCSAAMWRSVALTPRIAYTPLHLFTSPHTPYTSLHPLLQVYRSRHRHRVTTVTAPRTVLAVEWWRGEQTSLPTRPGGAGKELLEPAGTGRETGAAQAGSNDALALGNVDSYAIDEL